MNDYTTDREKKATLLPALVAFFISLATLTGVTAAILLAIFTDVTAILPLSIALGGIVGIFVCAIWANSRGRK